jgi:hypothetical protein
LSKIAKTAGIDEGQKPDRLRQLNQEIDVLARKITEDNRLTRGSEAVEPKIVRDRCRALGEYLRDCGQLMAVIAESPDAEISPSLRKPLSDRVSRLAQAALKGQALRPQKTMSQTI